jgi:hypothetical protein
VTQNPIDERMKGLKEKGRGLTVVNEHEPPPSQIPLSSLLALDRQGVGPLPLVN